MNYVEIEICCNEPLKEILTAELYQLGYESFLDTPEGLKAYLSTTSYDQKELEELISQYPQVEEFTSNEIVEENWNQQWESSFEPIVVDQRCRVRASFHPKSENFPYEIIIDPKMSFGTGHHETTAQMIKHMLTLDIRNQHLLDVGCGTGVLSILGEKMGASYITALDIDDKAVENTLENIRLNQCRVIEVLKGMVSSSKLTLEYHLILANINRNVLLEDIPSYAKLLSPGGHLIVSGFYTEDQPPIVNTCEDSGLQIKSQSQENKWASLILEKN